MILMLFHLPAKGCSKSQRCVKPGPWFTALQDIRRPNAAKPFQSSSSSVWIVMTDKDPSINQNKTKPCNNYLHKFEPKNGDLASLQIFLQSRLLRLLLEALLILLAVALGERVGLWKRKFSFRIYSVLKKKNFFLKKRAHQKWAIFEGNWFMFVIAS